MKYENLKTVEILTCERDPDTAADTVIAELLRFSCTDGDTSCIVGITNLALQEDGEGGFNVSYEYGIEAGEFEGALNVLCESVLTDVLQSIFSGEDEDVTEGN